MRDFKHLNVWQKAHKLALAVYAKTTEFPKEEQYGLTNQIRRCGVSIPANIAEGCGRESCAEFARFLQIALGSASELEYHILLASELSFLNKREYDLLTSSVCEVKKMLTSLIKKLKVNN